MALLFQLDMLLLELVIGFAQGGGVDLRAGDHRGHALDLLARLFADDGAMGFGIIGGGAHHGDAGRQLGGK